MYVVCPVSVSVENRNSFGIKVVPIIYGLPTQKFREKAKQGEVALGGCVIYTYAPKWKILIQVPGRKNAGMKKL